MVVSYRCARETGAEICAGSPDARLLLPGPEAAEPIEGAELWFRWDEEGFYLAARMADSDVVAGCGRDEELHFLHGDVLELFLKPEGGAHYWEMYATPRGNKSTLFFRAPRGEAQPDPLRAHGFRALEVRAGKLDGGWFAEMRVPASQLTSLGDAWGEGACWMLLAGRYNHGRRFPTPELSAFPSLSRADFHRSAEYARIELARAHAK